jgi:hypothetical protein
MFGVVDAIIAFAGLRPETARLHTAERRIASARSVDRFRPAPADCARSNAAGVSQNRLASQLSTVVVLMLIPRGQQHDVKVANGEEHYTPAMPEWNHELSKLLVLLGSTTGVRREREDRHCALYGVAESKQAHVVRRVACKLPLDDVLFKALNVFLERDGSDDPILGAHPLDRLFLAATAARMRCCAA